MGKGALTSDTYEVRKAEGRPKHGTNSMAIIAEGLILWFIALISILMPEWRSNWIGVMGYPFRRAWGLFTVTGKTTRFHHEVMTDTCRFFAQLSVGGVCASPICLWYRLKCQVFMDFMMVSYTSGFFFILALLIHTLCILWTMRLTPRMIRWAATWWCAAILIHVCAFTFWFMMTQLEFDTLDAEAMYPEPPFSMCFWCEMLVVFGLIGISLQGFALLKTWPEPESDSSSEDEDDDDDDDTDEDELDG
mmetsp:Transcript_156489/g.272288  ORF Transcript_156489/g.272288 Transcript_156489/m.272288 type:complete len:248 (+) Transcript_156489:122-865(+)